MIITLYGKPQIVSAVRMFVSEEVFMTIGIKILELVISSEFYDVITGSEDVRTGDFFCIQYGPRRNSPLCLNFPQQTLLKFAKQMQG